MIKRFRTSGSPIRRKKKARVNEDVRETSCYCGAQTKVVINHCDEETDEDLQAIRDLQQANRLTDIVFTVTKEKRCPKVEFKSYRKVVEVLVKYRKQLQQVLDQQDAAHKNCFLMNGTNPETFETMLNYLHTGTAALINVCCRPQQALDLARLAAKLNFYRLVKQVAKDLEDNTIITLDNVDQLYDLAKLGEEDCISLLEKCVQFMDEKEINTKTVKWKVKKQESCDGDTVTIVLDRPRHMNYIEFMVTSATRNCEENEKQKMTFTLQVAEKPDNWTMVIDNSSIYNTTWQWFYFAEQKVQFIEIKDTSNVDRSSQSKPQGESFLQRFKKLEKFVMCKRKNVELKFDQRTGYLVPRFDVIEYPQPGFQHVFPVNNITYCMSMMDNPRDKILNYFYHCIGDNNPLEFYLPQTCIIGSIRFHLYYSADRRTYDFEVRTKSDGESEEYELIGQFKKRSHWQTIHFNRRPVRWVSITGIGCSVSDYDKEFAVTHFECPAQDTYYDHDF